MREEYIDPMFCVIFIFHDPESGYKRENELNKQNITKNS